MDFSFRLSCMLGSVRSEGRCWSILVFAARRTVRVSCALFFHVRSHFVYNTNSDGDFQTQLFPPQYAEL